MPVDEARLRELLGVEADVDIEETVKAIKAKADAVPAPTTAVVPPAGTPAAPAGGAPAGTAPVAPVAGATNADGTPVAPVAPVAGAVPPVPVPAATMEAIAAAAAANPGQVVTLSAGVAAELVAAASAGTTAMGTLDAQARARAIEDAVRAGRITPAEAAANFALAQADAAGTVVKAAGPWADFHQRPPTELVTFLSGLAPGRFAVTELGAGNGEGAGTDDTKALDAVHESLFAGIAGA